MEREDNVQFLTRIMNRCPQGALGQAFILEAISKYAENVAKSKPLPETGLISGEAWKKTAEWVKQELDNHFSH
jgi:hypothetical protein